MRTRLNNQSRSYLCWMLRTFSLLIVLGLLLMSSIKPVMAQDAVSDLLGRINALRTSLGLAGYSLNGALGAAAQSQAQWMVDTGMISHTRPDGSTPSTRAAAAGYPSRWVSENIYGGTLATPNDAWNFWINSPIHYRGLTNPNYQEIGIGAAQSSWGQAYVLVFGNPGDSWSSGGTTGGGTNNDSSGESAAPPVFIVGYDEVGNLMHEIQPSDTIGDIALLYGYTWNDIPYLLQINHLTELDIRLLQVGSIFLVPPHAGTYTPSPLPPGVTLTYTPEPPTLTPTDITPSATLDFNQSVLTALAMTQTSAVTPTSTPVSTDAIPARAVTSADIPASLLNVQPSTPLVTLSPETPTTEPTQTAVTVAQVNSTTNSTTNTLPEVIVVRENQTSPVLIVAMVLQTLVVMAAAVVFVRQMRQR